MNEKLSLEETVKLILTESMNKSDYGKEVKNMIIPIIKHHIKIHGVGIHRELDHWKSEIATFFNNLKDIKYTHNNKLPTKEQFISHVDNTGYNNVEAFKKLWSPIKSSYSVKTNPDFHDIHQKFQTTLNIAADKISKNKNFTKEDL